MLRYITEKVHLPVQMGNCEYFSTHAVIKPIGSVGVDEAIASPLTCAHSLIDFAQQFEGTLIVASASIVSV